MRKDKTKLDSINSLSKFFIKKNKWITEEEYKSIHKYSKPYPTYKLLSIFGTYKDMLQYLEVGPMADEIKLLKPKPAVKKPKASAKPKTVKPAKAKESKDE